MKYSKIVDYFDRGVEGVNEFMKLEEIKIVIDTIEDYQGRFKANMITEESDLKEGLNILTGLHSETTVIAGILEAYAETNEARELLLAKSIPQDDGKGGKKLPTDEVAKSMSKVNNLIFERTCNLFKAFSKTCSQKIMTCQSQMNYLKGQKYMPQEEQ